MQPERKGKSMAVNRQDVIDCYRYILGREPESEEVIDEQFRIFGGGELRPLQNHFLASDEYHAKNGIMISYAQNAEDVILWRALRNVKDGFYIDVGANDPEHDSVTKWFYDHGWRGINMEPADYYFHRVKEMRPGDINLCQGAGAEHGKLKFFEIPGTGLSTLDPDVASSQKDKREIVEHEIEVVTLASVCEKYTAGREINFLKIDVEETEKQVLEGMDFDRFRPWILVVEVGEKRHIEWEEKLILNKGYKYTLYDGINRYYVAKEKYNAFGSMLSYPVGSLDAYERINQFMARKWKEELVRRYGELRDSENGK